MSGCGAGRCVDKVHKRGQGRQDGWAGAGGEVLAMSKSALSRGRTSCFRPGEARAWKQGGIADRMGGRLGRAVV